MPDDTAKSPVSEEVITEKAIENKPVAKKAKKSSKSSKSTKAKSTKKRASVPKRKQENTDIFSLDIGTRTVVGILAHLDKEKFCVDHSVSIPHTKRAMIDGQIEDIDEVAKVVRKVKSQLEDKAHIELSSVCIAAAGRALKTRCADVQIEIEGKDNITKEMQKSYELEAVAKAQSMLNDEAEGLKTSFYCVGYTVIKYTLDSYPINTLIGHKGKNATVELIAAFLPSVVVESLYAVTDQNKLDVASLTLEPIAAMNVIIPPEVRLINIALVDIGAGTSDIAISDNGSIVAYAMATVAGDEITEDIIKNYIVDFNTAEEMKMSCDKEEINYKDILGFEHTISSQEFFQSLFPAVGQLADTITKTITEANGKSPAAVFLVGGGSKIPDLAKYVAEKLGIPENRVAVGGKSVMKNISLGRTKINGPEYVTPIGIGVTATLQVGYDFSTIIVNGKKMRIFDTKKLTVLDMLMMAGFKSTQIIGRSGRSLVFYLNGEKQNFKGEISRPATITLNDMPSSLDSAVKQGDVIEFTPAQSGISAVVALSDIAGNMSFEFVTVDNVEYPIGNTITVNGEIVSSDYMVQNFDKINVDNVETVEDLIRVHSLNSENIDFFRNDVKLSMSDHLNNTDILTTKVKSVVATRKSKPVEVVQPEAEESIAEPVTEVKAEAVQEKQDTIKEFSVYLNGKRTYLEENSDHSPHVFLELMSIANVDFNNPPANADMILTINGKNASFMDLLHDGDQTVVRWNV